MDANRYVLKMGRTAIQLKVCWMRLNDRIPTWTPSISSPIALPACVNRNEKNEPDWTSMTINEHYIASVLTIWTWTYVIIHKQYAINIPISPQPCKQSIATSSGSEKPKDQSENQKPKKPGQSPIIDLPLRSIATDHINWKKMKQKKRFGSVVTLVSVALTKPKPQQVFISFVLPVWSSSKQERIFKKSLGTPATRPAPKH